MSRREYKVSVLVPEDVSDAEMKAYIESAVSTWKGQLDPETSLFWIDGDSVRVSKPKKPGRPPAKPCYACNSNDADSVPICRTCYERFKKAVDSLGKERAAADYQIEDERRYFLGLLATTMGIAADFSRGEENQAELYAIIRKIQEAIQRG